MKSDELVDLAIKSLILEVSIYPKPGLVDPIDNGSHKDMDFDTFIHSCFALREGFKDYFECGLKHQGTLKQLFDKIRIVGMENEKDMFKATSNVNTHKGANFLYGIVISAIAHLNYPKLDDLQLAIKSMTKGLVFDELQSLKSYQTHGEKVFRDYGIDGIRGEVERGIPNVFDIALPILKTNENSQIGRKQALLKLIGINQDSNMIKRGGIEGLKFGQQLARDPYEHIDDHLLMMNIMFKKRNLSPGGSADLLALSIFLEMYEKCIEKGLHIV